MNVLVREEVRTIVVVYMVGLAGISMPWSRPLFKLLIPFNFLFGIAMLLWFQEHLRKKDIFALLTIFLMGFLIEVVGVNTGFPFGAYRYEPAMGPQLLNTPISIGLSWVLLIYCCHDLSNRLRTHVVIKSLFGAGLMTIYDFLLEPVAMKIPMWTWEKEQVPLENYLSWFVVSFLFILFLHVVHFKGRSRVALAMLAVQFLFMVLLNFTYIKV